MTRFLSAFILTLLLATPSASAVTRPEGMTMHRAMAGEPDSSGWATATSTRGGFSVRLPVRFSDYTLEVPPSEGEVAKIFVVAGSTVEGITFTAARLVYRRRDGAQHFFSRLERGEGLPAAGTAIEPRRFAGRKAIDVTLRNDRALAFARYVLLEDSLIYLIVETPANHRDRVAGSVTQRFLDSLDVLSPGAGSAPGTAGH